MSGMEEAEDEDEDESRLELCDTYFVEGKSEVSEESEEDGLAKDPDFTSCGTRWLDSEDSCRRSLQIALQRTKCRCIEAQVKLEKTPSDACLKRKATSFYKLCSQEEESARVELLTYEEERVICDLRHVRARSDLVEEIDSLTRSIGWMVIDLKPDQKWEVAHDRVMAQDLLSRSERKAGNLKKALRDWDAGILVTMRKGATQEWL